MFRTAYGEKERVQYVPSDEPGAQQNFKKECDINFILSKYRERGIPEHLTRHGARYEALPDAIDYHDALNMVLEARELFDDLPPRS